MADRCRAPVSRASNQVVMALDSLSDSLPPESSVRAHRHTKGVSGTSGGAWYLNFPLELLCRVLMSGANMARGASWFTGTDNKVVRFLD